MINIWGLAVTIFIFLATRKLKEKNIFAKIPPTVSTGIILILLIKVFNINYEIYNESACFLTLLLGPATIALAYPLVENIELLTKNKRAVYFGFITATVTAILSTIIIGKLFHNQGQLIFSLMPKSVTTPIAVEISKTIGGIPELTACIVVITGVYGAVFGHKLLKLIKIKSDVATGLAIGAASHVLGTSTCIEKKRNKQVVMATLALIITGILTAVICGLLFHV